jgi:hypothetical protein
MPSFKIFPTDQSLHSAEVIAGDATEVLGIVARLDCKEADVLQGDAYLYSVRLDANGLWYIFQRQPEPGPDTLEAFG